MQTASATGSPAMCNMPQRDATENEAYFNWPNTQEHVEVACRKRERVGRGRGRERERGRVW